MTTIHKIAKNTGVLLVGNLTYRSISFIVAIYLARYLGVESFGKYSFIFAYLGFFGIITDLGLGDILVREMSRDSENMPIIFGNAFIIKLTLSIIAIFLSIMTISLIGYPAETTTCIHVASIMLLFMSFSDAYRTVFQTTLTMKYDIISKLIYRLVSAWLILYTVHSQGTLLQLILILLFSESIRTLLNYEFSKKIFIAKYNIDFLMWKFLFKESLPIALSSVFLLIYHRIDIIMLSMMKDDISVGLYSAAYKLSEPLSLIPFAFISSFYPVMSRSFKNSMETLNKSYEICLKYIIIFMAPIVFGTTIISDEIILLVYGSSYSDSSNALKILIWGLLFISINYLLTSLLISIDKQKLTTLNMGVCVLINVVLNYLLIPQYNYTGASIATLATELTFFIISYHCVSKNIKSHPIHRISIKPVEACLIMSIFICYLKECTDFDIIVIIFFASLVYSTSLLKLNVFSSEEIAVIKKLLKLNR
ncbi:flippase [Methanosarcina sp. Mfa9]|uniref:flippase n=1 Tax=Methanosarcina sp. Mfa9 TaxID=3439063 RepID=UPI003F83B013